MVSFENRRAAAIGAVSTGSAEDCRSQPSMGQSTAAKKKTPTPGALEWGSVLRSSRLTSRTSREAKGNRGETRLRPLCRCQFYGRSPCSVMNNLNVRVANCRKFGTVHDEPPDAIDDWQGADR